MAEIKHSVKGLAGFIRHYPQGGTRFITGPDGKRYTERDIQAMRHGGIQFEQRVPASERKQYTRQLKNAKRTGPFYSEKQLTAWLKKNPSRTGYLQGYGKTGKAKKSPQKGKHFRNMTSKARFDSIALAIEQPNRDLSLTQQVKGNRVSFEELEKFYIYERE